MKGFLTHRELTECKCISNKKNVTPYEENTIVRFWVKLNNGSTRDLVTMTHRLRDNFPEDFNRLLGEAMDYFKNKKELV